ncbi:MAG: rhodanese-like domain-containing protein [Desulfobacterium sp.]|nr:rhodanese-like domain-containing protein [Desulfobacterium sp.]
MVGKCMKTLLLGSVLLLLFSVNALAAWQYPAESGYGDIPTIGVEELYDQFKQGKALIVDVRSSIEYSTAHIQSAINIKVSVKDFVKRLQNAVAQNPGKLVYMYCNGTTCLKSPLATQKALAAGITGTCSFYDGLPVWAEVYPSATILRGKPVSDSNKLIPKADFKKMNLGFDDFKAKIASDSNAMVIDIRDNIQRTASLPGIDKKVLSIPMDKLIPNFLKKKKHQTKTLFIYDQVGKQVQALEYELIDNGYTNYWFLKKGATNVLGKQVYKK